METTSRGDREGAPHDRVRRVLPALRRAMHRGPQLASRREDVLPLLPVMRWVDRGCALPVRAGEEPSRAETEQALEARKAEAMNRTERIRVIDDLLTDGFEDETEFAKARAGKATK